MSSSESEDTRTEQYDTEDDSNYTTDDPPKFPGTTITTADGDVVDKINMKTCGRETVGAILVVVIFFVMIFLFMVVAILVLSSMIMDLSSCKNFKFNPGRYHIESTLNGTSIIEEVLVSVGDDIMFCIRNGLCINIVRSF